MDRKLLHRLAGLLAVLLMILNVSAGTAETGLENR